MSEKNCKLEQSENVKRFSWKTEKLQNSDDEVLLVVDNENKDWKGHIINIVDLLNSLAEENEQLKIANAKWLDKSLQDKQIRYSNTNCKELTQKYLQLKEENENLRNFIELMNMRQKWKLYNYKRDNDGEKNCKVEVGENVKRFELDVRLDMPKLLIDTATNKRYHLLLINDIEEIVDLLNELSDENNILNKNEDDLKECTIENIKLKEENEQLKNYFKKRAECSNFQINKLKEEIAELQEDNVDTIVELSKENEQLKKSEKINVEYAEQIVEENHKLRIAKNDLRIENEQLQEKNKILEEDVNDYHNALFDLHKKYDKLEKENEKLKDDLHNCRLNKNIISEKLKLWQDVHKEYDIYNINDFEELMKNDK